MVISGDALKIRKFYDQDTNQFVEVELKVRDIIYFRLLENLEHAIRKGRA